MSTIAIVMMLLFMAIIWGGLLVSAIWASKGVPTQAAEHLAEHPEEDD